MKFQLTPAIDLHTHLNHGSPYDTKVSESHHTDLPFLQMQYESLNIVCGGFSTFASLLSDKEILEENDYLEKVARENDSVYQWVVIDPRQDETFRQADRILRTDKCLGIKIHPSCHGYDINEYADKLFGYAHEKNAWVLMHPQINETMPNFANKYPHMNLILAHLSVPSQIRAVLEAKHGNIYVDTSGSASNQNNIIELGVEKIGAERIFFGTDTYSGAFQRGRIEFARIADEDKEKILYQNAKTHFGHIIRF